MTLFNFNCNSIAVGDIGGGTDGTALAKRSLAIPARQRIMMGYMLALCVETAETLIARKWL